MRNFLLCILGVVGALTAGAQQDCLVVWQKDGTKVLFALSEEPKVLYTDSMVTIEAGTTIEYAFQSIRKMTFETEAVEAVREPATASGRPFARDGQTVSFESSDSDLQVRIVSMGGVVVKGLSVRRGERSQFSFQPFPAGVYLISVNGVTYKVMTR